MRGAMFFAAVMLTAVALVAQAWADEPDEWDRPDPPPDVTEEEALHLDSLLTPPPVPPERAHLAGGADSALNQVAAQAEAISAETSLRWALERARREAPIDLGWGLE